MNRMALTARQVARHFASCADRTARLMCTVAAENAGPSYEPGFEGIDSRTASFGELSMTEEAKDASGLLG